MNKFILGTVLTIIAFASNAMTIEHRTFKDTGKGLISATGPIQKGDNENLKRMIALYPNERVVLASGGGSVPEAEKMAKTLRKNGVTTMVHSEYYCASACGIVFIGGKERIIWDSGDQIGFHAISVNYGLDISVEQYYIAGQMHATQYVYTMMVYVPPGKEWELMKLINKLTYTDDPRIMRYPSAKELLDAGIATTVFRR